MLSIALLVLVVVIYAWDMELTTPDTHEHDRGIALLFRLHEILEQLQQAQIAQRGYLLTGRENDLESYLRAQRDVTVQFKELESLAVLDATLIELVRELKELSTQQLASVEPMVELRRRGDDERALVVLLNDDGQRMQIIRSRVSRAMTQTAQTQRYVARARYDQLRHTRITVYLAALFVSVLLVLAYISYRRSFGALAAQSERLSHEATHDVLTGLPNRRMLLAELTRATARANRQGGGLGVLYMDIDGLKSVNDTMGHAAGDGLLRSIAQHFSATLRPCDMLARVGGDEFVLLIEGDFESSKLLELAHRLIAGLKMLTQSDYQSPLGVSIGIASFPKDVALPSELIGAADTSMYLAKQGGGNCARFFNKSTERELSGSLVPATHQTQLVVRESLDHAVLALITEQIRTIEIWLHVARTTKLEETRQRCLLKARKAYDAVSASVDKQAQRGHNVTGASTMLEAVAQALGPNPF